MNITLRPACQQDFDYCWSVYAAETTWMIHQLNLDGPAQVIHFRKIWNATQVRLIVHNHTDAGWLQTDERKDTCYLSQMYVARAFQRRGIGSAIMQNLISECEEARRSLELSVVRTNPAVRLYKRFGFYVTGENEQKFSMRRAPGLAAPIANFRP
jgi:ribosomal protein S18 acetylase RimI-like enzyme